jgi:hypothetical protein
MMQKVILLIGMSALSCTLLFAQEIKAYKTFGGMRFERDTVVLGINQVMQILKETPAAYSEIRKARTNQSASSLLGFAGVVLAGLPLGTAIAGGDPEWGMAAGGAALIFLSVPFSNAFRKHAGQALYLYNSQPASRIKTEFQFSGNRAALIIRF